MTGTWRRTERLSSEQRLEILALLDRLDTQYQREALDEGRRRAVVHGWPTEHWLLIDADRIVSYAQVSNSDPVVVEVAGGGFDADLYAHLSSESPRIDWWTRDDQGTNHGGQLIRTLHLLEVDLPVEVAAVPADVTMRTFEPGHDNDAWIDQNNQAFADHPEQGAWNQRDLSMRLAEPWFDPSGFLLFEAAGRIVASLSLIHI